ncbi:hypothetical protein Goshw_023129 [Gossypium schwendimanii]|uniref:RNase H type-1 domain-containing protein n=2 Tax=Gossypium schwendimanii TaxID=34291 RepID=A0A7J9N9F5_GOSSC|nr:hypothetical protein [Gossypium schwendimanii]
MVTAMKWLAPESGWVKLNIDGAFLLNSYSTAIGGVIRDAEGKQLCGYSMVLGKDKVFGIEARSMLEGLRLLWDKGYPEVELECDNALLVEIILAGEALDCHFMELRAIHKLIQRN